MDKFWIYAAFASLFVAVQALQVESFPDYLNVDDNVFYYDDELDFSGEKNKELSEAKKLISNKQNASDEDSDRKVVEEIEMFRNDNEVEESHINDESAGALGDYQFEDNRSEVDEDEENVNGEVDSKEQESEDIDPELRVLNDLASEIEDLNKIKEALDDSKTRTDDESEHNVDELQGEHLNPVKKFEIDTDDIIKIDSTIKELTENEDKVQGSMESFNENFDENDEDFSDNIKAKSTENSEIVKETKTLGTANEELPENDKEMKSQEEDEKFLIGEDDMKSFQEAYDDLDNWDKLFDKLDEIEAVKDKDEMPTSEERDFDETFKALMEDYDYFSLSEPATGNNENDTNVSIEEPFPDDTRPDEEASRKESTIEYIHDALEASDEAKNPDAEMINETSPSPTTTQSVEEEKEIDDVEDDGAVEQEDKAAANATSTTVDYDHLSASEYERIMDVFESKHSGDFNFTSEDFDKHIAPVHMTINDQPVVVTSPNYPNNYPTNNIVDWIFQGDGEGIELNITDFAVNGHLGDYLLVKPGGVDASGNEGLIFSYTLTTERRYRFMDVNRMFVRFEARPGMAFMRGFSFSVRMLRQIQHGPEPEPTPKPVVRPAHSAITLNLGGTTLESFVQEQVEREFRQIVADMATMYINANGIDPGLNSTSEVTQILSSALCFHNWPKFENCVEVRFGVPLEYEDEEEPRLNVEDLTTMWATYFNQDPFAARLRRLGITEYQVPNDRGIMTVWLVIAAGVAISVAMLAFALWRFSCFEGYTRMPPTSDSDSVHEKRNLDLYPTPHQTLPPLYAESEYKWPDPRFDGSTRVDMGGYANRNYLRDDLYDLDSDDDVSVARNSNKNITPRDIFV